MFPNDDICNIKAAKDAAKRLFDKYRTPLKPQTSSKSGLGENQVSSLIKNAYDTINMPYDPNQQDVFSFMSVFDADNSGKIQLKDLQQMAVRYLCGEEALKQMQQKDKEKQVKTLSSQLQKIQLSKQVNQNSQVQQKKLNIKQEIKVDKKRYQNKGQIQGFLSPKVQTSKNYFKSKSTLQVSQQMKEVSQNNQNKRFQLSYKEILNKANRIFNQNLNQSDKLTEKQVGKLLNQTYELIGRKNYHPSEQDVIIWMRLCDIKRCGSVDWFQYETYVKKILQREGISQNSY